jgi:hypothetical protein
LRILRDLLRDFKDGTAEVQKQGAPLPHIQKHAMHCFDYLIQVSPPLLPSDYCALNLSLQGITCAADGALEPTLKNTIVVTGYNAEHECHDHERLWVLAKAAP